MAEITKETEVLSKRDVSARAVAVPLLIDDAATTVRISLERDAWPEKTTTEKDVVTVVAEMSVDGGLTWALLCGFTAHGGVHLDTDGNPVPSSSVQMEVPPAKDRQIRVSITPSLTVSTSAKIGTD